MTPAAKLPLKLNRDSIGLRLYAVRWTTSKLTKSLCILWQNAVVLQSMTESKEWTLELYARLLDLVAGRVKATESRLAQFCGSAITRAASLSAMFPLSFGGTG